MASTGGTVLDQGGAVVNVKAAAYGAKGDGVTDDAAAFQAAVTAATAVNGVLVIPPSANPYVLKSNIVVAGDLTAVAYGATLQWQGGTINTMWTNSVPIHLRWYGGKIDGNSVAVSLLFGFGSESATPAAVNLLSCEAADIEFVNVYSGAWQCNYITNTGTNPNRRVVWRNLKCTKATGGNGNDMFTVVAAVADIDVSGFENGTNAAVWTSAWLKAARVRSIAVDTNGLPVVSANHPAAVLQSYNSNGPAPFFVGVTLEANALINLVNGNLAAPAQVSDGVVVTCLDSTAVEIGTSAFDQWANVTFKGVHKPLGGLRFQYGNVENLTLDLTIDAVNIPNTAGQPGLIVVTDNNNGGTNVYYQRLVVRNAVSGSATGIIYVGATGTFTRTTINGGDISENVGIPMFAGTVATLGTLVVRNVAGYNPVGASVPGTAWALPASTVAWTNNTGVDGTLYVTAAGTVTAVSVNNVAISGTLAVGDTYRVKAGGTWKATYSVAPTLVFVGD